MKKVSTVSQEKIERRILMVRGNKVMLDSDLAQLYGVSAKQLIQAVKRNVERFPRDFAFQLEAQDVAALRSQIVTSKIGPGGRRYLPYVFTEQGVAMFSTADETREIGFHVKEDAIPYRTKRKAALPS